LEFLEETDKSTIKLFVTTPTDKVATVKSLLTSKGYNFTCLGVSNRGRDILPFIKILPEIVEQKFTYLVKVHTKKTTNRTDGNGWRNDLYTKLLSKAALHENLQFFDNHPDVGIIAPEGHLLYMNLFLADNEEQVMSLSARLGMEMDAVMQLSFVAGSMYGARIHALMPLLLLNLEENEFETEKGQIDGTLAHAIERVMSVCISRLGYKISTHSGETKSEYAHAMNTTSAYTSS
jgi:lipopolysaccharide biosynthesis protein